MTPVRNVVCSMLCALGLAACAAAAPAAPRVLPLRWGFDDIGLTSPPPWHQATLLRHPRGAELVREFGFDLWLMWYPDVAPDWGYEANRAFIKRIDAWCEANGMHWMPNTLGALWNNAPRSRKDTAGYDWFVRPDGRRYFLYPPELLAEFGRCKRLLGVMYDEPEHHQNNANGVPGLDMPAIYDPAGDALEEAADAHTRAARAVANLHRRHGLRVYTEHVTPVMYHTFSRAGFTAGTKVLKEAWSPAYVACALGASIQYRKPLWVTPDLWGHQGYPTHSPEAYRSALLLAYHLGADCIYTESLCLTPTPNAPHQVTSLVEVTDTDYRITPYGEVAREFIKEYVPAHPRRFERSRLKPRAVIVRQEDGCYGQRSVGAPWLPDRLFGSREWRSTPTTEAWLAAWHLLSGGAIPRASLYLSWADFGARPSQVFHPLDGVVVYDHHVGHSLLRDAEVIFLAGVGVSPGTRAAVARCVRDGATCVALPHLAPAGVRKRAGLEGTVPAGKGRWVLDTDLASDAVRRAVAHVLPQGNFIRYRFGDTTVTLRPQGGDRNRLVAEVVARRSGRD